MPTFAWHALLECIPEWHLIHKAFLEIAVTAQTKFKDADAIANAIGCAPLPEILIQNVLNPWLEQGFAVRSSKDRYDGTKSYSVTILQLSIGDKIAIDLCPVR